MSAKAAELQKQVRENADDYQNYLKSLYQWEDEIKIKDEVLKNSSKRSFNDQVCTCTLLNIMQKFCFTLYYSFIQIFKSQCRFYQYISIAFQEFPIRNKQSVINNAPPKDNEPKQVSLLEEIKSSPSVQQNKQKALLEKNKVSSKFCVPPFKCNNSYCK